MSSEKSLQVIANEARTKSLTSIRNQGLVPLEHQSNLLQSNSVFNTESSKKNICVNYVNLKDKTADEAEVALHVATHEEYCGIYGILMERQWGFHRYNDQKMKLEEIQQRLQSSVVFILKPPHKNPLCYKVPGCEEFIEIQFYQFSGVNALTDGFSQSRGRSLVTGTDVKTQLVTEVKTIHQFAPVEILAALVPKNLMALAQTIFQNTAIQLIEVPLVEKEFSCIPAILKFLHNEAHEEKFLVKCPDYMESLKKLVIGNSEMQRFAIHAVRLHTSFDFMPRYILNYENHSDFIQKNHGVVVSSFENHAWVVFHKDICVSREKVITRLSVKYPEKAEQIKNATKLKEEKFQAIKKFQGEFELFVYYKTIAPEVMKILIDKKIALFGNEHYVMLAFRNEIEKKEVLSLMNNPQKIVVESSSNNVFSSPLSTASQEPASNEKTVKEDKGSVANSLS